MLAMSLQACKFGSLLVILFALPLIIEMQAVLDLWLGQPPQYAAPICQWLLAMLIVDRMTTGHMLAVNARGKIALYELIQGLTLVTALPLMWLFFKLNSGPVGVGVALFITMAFYCIGRILFAKYLLQFPVISWLQSVAFPVLALVLASGLCGSLAAQVSLSAFWHIVLTTLVCLCVSLSFAWSVLFNAIERSFALNAINKLLGKVLLKNS
jgi:hypothetical protein